MALDLTWYLSPLVLLVIAVGQSELLVMTLKGSPRETELWAFCLPDGEVSGAREFGCDGEGGSAMVMVLKRKRKKPLSNMEIFAFWAVGLDL